MYSFYDYAYNGLLYLNNIMRPRHKRLSQLMIYSTTACQSRCKHCNIWQKPVEHLSLDDIKRIMQSKCVTKRTTVGLEGGEFVRKSWHGFASITLITRCFLIVSRPVGSLRQFVAISPDICMFLSTVTARLTSGCEAAMATIRLFKW